MSDAIKVTVDGEPVTHKVTMDQVCAYLTRRGWKPLFIVDGSYEAFAFGGEHGPRVFVPLVVLGNGLSGTVCSIATQERRHPAEVLREIAGVPPLIGRAVAYIKRAAEHLQDDVSDDKTAEALRLARELALISDGTGQRERSPAEVLADEIEAEPNAGMITFHDAVRWAKENYELACGSPKHLESCRARAAAWLLVAQRIIARGR